jgi:ketosteroid isomerase-like protein
MSRENVEVVRRMVEAYWAGEAETALALLDPELEWDISAHPLPDWPNTGRGRDEYVRYLTGYMRGWREYRGELRELLDGGEEIMIVLGERVKLRDSGAILDRDLHQVWTVRNGLAARCRVFKTREEALEAAGLSE